jgi:calcineurin-like phosphoesterase
MDPTVIYIKMGVHPEEGVSKFLFTHCHHFKTGSGAPEVCSCDVDIESKMGKKSGITKSKENLDTVCR